MVTVKKLKKFLNKRFGEVEQHLTAFCLNQHPEELHQLRVAVKKVYALTHLLQFCAGDTTHTIPIKKIKKIFKHAGKIRTAWINLQLVKDYAIENAQYNTEQQTLLVNESQQFCAAINQYQQDIKKGKRKIKKSIHPIEYMVIGHFYHKQMQELTNLFYAPLPTETLHEIRKKIKDLLYIQAFLPKEFIRKANLQKAYLDELQEVIGQWHDATVTLNLLTEKGLADKEIIARLTEKAQQQLEKLNVLAEHFYHKTGYTFASY